MYSDHTGFIYQSESVYDSKTSGTLLHRTCLNILCSVLFFFSSSLFILCFAMANSLNHNARLQENHFLTLHGNITIICSAIEEARYTRHDMHHHFLNYLHLLNMDPLNRSKIILTAPQNKITDLNMHFCENKAADSVISYYCALAKRRTYSIQSEISLPRIFQQMRLIFALYSPTFWKMQ